MGAVLPGTHAPVKPGCDGIVAAYCFGVLRGEPYFATGKCDTMRAIQRPGIYIGQGFLRSEVNDIYFVRLAIAHVRNIGGLSIGRGNDLVRVLPYRHTCDDLERDRVNNSQDMI